MLARRPSTDALSSRDTMAGRRDHRRSRSVEVGINPMGEGSIPVKVPNATKRGSRSGHQETEMSSTWKILSWSGTMRVLWVSVVLFMAACTATDRPLSPPAVLSPGGQHGRAERPALDRILSSGEIHVAEGHLRDFGFDPGPVDGLFTAETRTAVRAFQARYGIPVSGLLDRETRRELLPGLDQWEFDP
jgi:hypothetical protein